MPPHFPLPSLCLAVWLAGGTPAFCDAPAVFIETTDTQFTGRLVRLDRQHGLGLEGAVESVVAWDRVLGIRFDRPRNLNGDPAWSAGTVRLIDGSEFAYLSVSFEAARLIFRLPGSALVDTPIAAIQEWRLGPSAGETPFPTSDAASDVLLIQRRDGGVAPVEGVVLGVSDTGVRFDLGQGEPVEANWPRVAGLRFYRDTQVDEASAAPVVRLLGGANLAASRLSVADGRLSWGEDDGPRGEAFLTSVKAIDLSAGRVTHVGDLTMLNDHWRPYLDLEQAGPGYAFNESTSGEPLSLRAPDPRSDAQWPAVATTRWFDRGVALRSEGSLLFALPTNAARVRGWIGLCPTTGLAGSAEVKVTADETPLFEGVIDGTTRPVPLDAPLRGARTLTLRVDYGDNLDTGDIIHFADLRVIQ